MFWETKITWEKLCLELELLKTEEPPSLVPLALGIQSLLTETIPSPSLKALNFCCYDIDKKCDHNSTEKRLQLLNSYFFSELDFQLLNFDNGFGHLEPWLFSYAMMNKTAAPIMASIIYAHFAKQLEIPIKLTNSDNMMILRWERKNGNAYIDLSNKGSLHEQSEIANLYNKIKNPPIKDCEFLTPIKTQKIIKYYLQCLCKTSTSQKNLHLYLKILNMMLKLDPWQAESLGERALLLKELGYHKEAIQDLQRYFSFSDRNQAPRQIKLAYYELKAIDKDKLEMLKKHQPENFH